MSSYPQQIRVALAGNPNAGKTTLFNGLTGARQHVGNYPGVTVERRQGHYLDEGVRHEVVDLPGTYSLNSLSLEERIAQQELLEGQLDVVVAVVDATTLRRSLAFLAQLMLLDTKLVLCLNMADEAEQAGQRVDLKLLSRLLGMPVVETVGHRQQGLDRLKDAVAEAAAADAPRRVVLGERADRALEAVQQAHAAVDTPTQHPRWIASRILVDDPTFARPLAAQGEAGQRVLATAAHQRQLIEAETGRDIGLYLTQCNYGFVSGMLQEVLHEQPRADWRAASDLVDRVLAHRWLGLPFFLAAMYATFWVAFSLGEIPMAWIETGVDWLSAAVAGMWPVGSASLLRSLVIDGVIGGVGGVIVFVPNIALLFLCLSLLEDTGYLSRAAFLVDRLMHRFGLHGKSFLPLITGFGCSIPGIMATRTLENERDRLSTMLVLPLMSCGARLPIWMVLIPAFVAAKYRALALWGVYAAGIVVALGLVFVLRRTLLRGEEAPFVMELPPYRLPTMRAAASRTLERSWLYLRKAGTIILAISLLMWFASTFPQKPSFEVDQAIAAGQLQLASAGSTAAVGVQLIEQTELERRRAAERLAYSFAGRLGQRLEPLLSPLGFDWRINTALVGAFAAKEVFVAQMGIIYSLGEAEGAVGQISQSLQRDYSPLVGLSLILFLLIATPCMATMAATRRESGSWRWALLQFAGLTVVAYLVSLVVYQGGMLISGGDVNLDAIGIVLVLCFVCWVLARRLARHLPTSSDSAAVTSGCGSCGSATSPSSCSTRDSTGASATTPSR